MLTLLKLVIVKSPMLIAELNKEYLDSIEKLTPDKIKRNPLIDLSQADEFTLIFTKQLVDELGLDDWLTGYRREAQYSTGGIRGPQNVLYSWDTRFPINQIGILLATVAKAMVLQSEYPDKVLHKIVAGEVRYNTDQYIELISRLQAALGITIHQPKGIHLTTIWMTSFLIFMLDYDGGEYVSSSHAVSSKTATKDLENQGSQFLLEMSLAFVDKIGQIIHSAKSNDNGYSIKISARQDSHIVKDFDGFALYAKHLETCAATVPNMAIINKAAEANMRIMFDTMGGCMNQNLIPLFKVLGMPEIFDWHNAPEDPFFHGVGKTRKINPRTGREEFFDLSCDVSLPEVARTMGYDIYLKDKPIGYPTLITDPDGDRLLIAQVESKKRSGFLDEVGIDHFELDQDRIVTIYHPAYTFLLIMDFHMRQLKAAGLWADHPRFITTTTPSPRTWEEWAKKHGIAVVATPVGIKELATVMKKAEKQILNFPEKDVARIGIERIA